MTTEAIYALFPDSKFVHGGDHLMHRSVGAFLAVVERLHQEITVTDCKVYNPLPPFLGHRHEFTMVVANVDGEGHFHCLITPNVLSCRLTLHHR